MSENRTIQMESAETSYADAALIAAYRVALAVASEARLEVVLQSIVELAREVVPARYSALGIADDHGTLLQFLFAGIDTATTELIGHLPEGRGLLGALIQGGKPLHVEDIAADPRSVGFPPNHPPMRSLLGVPILLDDQLVGNLYLSERLDGRPFSNGDRVAVQMLAVNAATAIQRSRLFAEIEAARRMAEEQRDHLQVILDQLPSAVLIHRMPDGDVELANATARKMFLAATLPDAGFPRIDRDYALLRMDGTRLEFSERPEHRALRGDTIAHQQLTLAFPDGPEVPVSVQAAPLRDSAGEIRQAVVILQDVTRLREAEQLKDDFLSLVSHEFRTPLTAIHGGAYLLSHQGETLDAETRSELLSDVVNESTRLDQMLTNMLSLVQVTAGRLEPRTEPVLLAPLVRRVARELASRSSEFVFDVELPLDLAAAEGDPALLEQVLRNVYENAVKYTPGGGAIVTTASQDRETVTLHITDHGAGIITEHVAHVFERFRRPGASPTVRGMGLGLYLCRHLMEAQSGRILVASPGAGQGATFSLELPVAVGWNER